MEHKNTTRAQPRAIDSVSVSDGDDDGENEMKNRK